MRIIFILILVLSSLLQAENLLNMPESVEWDHINETWLVSNHGSGEIISYIDQQNQVVFNDFLSSTRGLKVRGEKLYAASDEGVAIFDLASKELDTVIYIPAATLLNDLEFDNNGYLFVSDYWGNKVFRINSQTYEYEQFIDLGVLAPNGLIFDEVNSRIICAGHNGVTTRIFAFDVTSGEVEILWIPTIHSLDGWAIDQSGDLYVSSWHTDAIYRFNQFEISADYELVLSGVEDPADIFINLNNNILAVPLFYADSIYFHQIEPVSSGTNQIEKPELKLSVFPNPFQLSGANRSTELTISFDLPAAGFISLDIFNLKGQKVKSLTTAHFSKGSHSLSIDGKNSAGDALSTGMYFVKLASPYTTVVKKLMLLQ